MTAHAARGGAAPRMLRAAAVLLLLSAAAVDAEVSDKLLASLIGQQLRLSLRQADLRQSIWIETALDKQGCSFLLVLAVGGRTATLIALRNGAINRPIGTEHAVPSSAFKPVDGRRTRACLETLPGRFGDALGIVFLHLRVAFTIASANKRSRDWQTVRDPTVQKPATQGYASHLYGSRKRVRRQRSCRAPTWHVVLNRHARTPRFPLPDVLGLQSARSRCDAVYVHGGHPFGEWLLRRKILTVKTR